MSLTRRDFLFVTSAAALLSAVAHSALAQIDRAGSTASAPSATPMQRAEELLRTMTIEEKAMQGIPERQIGMAFGKGRMGHTSSFFRHRLDDVRMERHEKRPSAEWVTARQ